MKKLIAILFLTACYQLNAQKNIDGLINAEKSFAAYSVANGTRDAFLKFLDSNGIVFDQDKAVNGIEVWKKREKRPAILNWHPLFAEIASSNDFGYTTGPWFLKPGANNDSVIARGQYITVWHIDEKDEWRFLVDIGVSNTLRYKKESLRKIEDLKFTGVPSTADLLKEELNFIELYKKDKSKAYENYLSKSSILNRNGLQHPATERKAQTDMIENTPSDIQFSVEGSGMASSGDLAYVYGNTVVNNKHENFLHIWRREKQGWKIALEVLRY